MYKILISGYYGFNNIGDESILRTVIDNLRGRLDDIEIEVLSHNPADTAEKYGVKATDRMSPMSIIKAVKRCDMLISGGGSLLQDVTSKKSIIYYLFIMRLALLFKKKVFIYSQGIGPIDEEKNRRMTARILKRVHGIVVRDESSAALLEEIGVPAEKVTVTADPVIRVKRAENSAGAEILKAEGCPKREGKLTVGWAIREKDLDSDFVGEVAESIKWLKETYDADSVLIPFHYEEDMAVSKAIAEKLGDIGHCLKEKYLSEDMLSIIGNMDVLVGVRLHSLIYAGVMGVPMIGVSYDPKCTAFLKSVGLEKMSSKEDFTAEKFKEEFKKTEESRKEISDSVSEKITSLVKKLDTNESMIKEIIDNDREKSAAPKRAAGAIGIVFILTVLAKLLGVVREMFQASIFGTSIDADLFTASYNSTLYLFTTVCYALCIAAVPILTKEFASDRKKGFRASNNLLTITLAASIILVGVWQILASTPRVGMIWSSAAGELVRLTGYIRIMSLALPIVAAAYLMVAMFQSLDHYELQGSMSIPYNVFLALFLGLFGAKLGMGGVIIACTAAWLLQLGMSVPYARKENYVFKPVLDLKAGYVGTYFKTAGVTVLTTSVFLFCYLIDTSSAASFSDGGAVSAFYYADKLFTPLTTTVIYSISAVMFPRFNREYTKDNPKEYLGYIWNVTSNTLLFVFPVCAMMCVFGESIIKVIFESGSFTAESTAVTGNIFMMYALGMSAFCVLDLLNKAYYTMKKTLVPLLINLGILALNLILNQVFASAPGVALATAISITAGAVVMIFCLFREQKIVKIIPLVKGLISGGVMALVMWGGTQLLLNGNEGKIMLIIKCVAVGAVGCIVYVAVSALLKQKTVTDILKRFTK